MVTLGTMCEGREKTFDELDEKQKIEWLGRQVKYLLDSERVLRERIDSTKHDLDAHSHDTLGFACKPLGR